MATTTTTPGVGGLGMARHQRSLWGDAWRRLLSSIPGRIGLTITLLLVLLALLVLTVRQLVTRGTAS